MQKLITKWFLIITIIPLLLYGVNIKAQEAYFDGSYINLKNGYIPAIMYHHLSTDPKELSNYCISPHKLENDFKKINELGLTPISLSELKSLYQAILRVNNKITSTNLELAAANDLLHKYSNPILITFDDGYSSSYQYLLPLLKKYNFKATVFAIGKTAQESKQGSFYMDFDTLKQMNDSGLVEVQSHTYDLHFNNALEIRSLDKNNTNYDLVKKDFDYNNALFEARLGHKPNAISYPYGVYNQKSEDIATGSGIEISFHSKFGFTSVLKNKLRLMGRLDRSNELSTYNFFKFLLTEWKNADKANAPNVEQIISKLKRDIVTFEAQTNAGTSAISSAIIINNKSYAKLQELCGLYSFKYQRYPEAKLITINQNNSNVIINELNNIMLINGQEQSLGNDLDNNLISIKRFVAIFGGKLQWDGDTNKVQLVLQ